MSEEVHGGRDGWLFLVGGSNAVGDIYNGVFNVGSWQLGWANLISKRRCEMLGRGIKYLHISAPEKIAVYNRYVNLPWFTDSLLVNSPARQVEDVINKQGVKSTFINPMGFLIDQSYKYQVYHKTDTHWNFTGAYSVYQMIMSRLGLSCNSNILSYPRKTGLCVMDLGAKLNPNIKEEVYFFKPNDSVNRIWVNKIVEFKEANKRDNDAGLHTGSAVIYVNSKALHKKKVLIFGDSFSEYRPQLITGLLSDTFSQVMFVWSLNIDYSIVDFYEPDIVITEAAERFMPRTIPSDEFSLISYENEKLEAIQCEEGNAG